MGLMESLLRRLPLSPAMFYLPIGYLLGEAGLGMVTFVPTQHAGMLTLVTEIALLISLFTVGLKLRVPLSDPLWWLPLRLGVLAMLLTIAMLTAIGYWLLHLPLGAAVLLAAILAPTDPILASDVQIQDSGDRDRIRFSLSGEGGLNDGTTFPFVMLGLGLLAVPAAAEYTAPAAIWLVVWGGIAGLMAGGFMGWLIGNLVVHLRGRYQMALGMEEFLTLGLIALSYGVASLIGGIGFIAVFAAGVAVRRIEFKSSGARQVPSAVIGPVTVGEEADAATDPAKAPAYMTETVLGFNQQLEHIAEFVMVLLLGVMLSSSGISAEGVWLAAILFVVVRPLAVLLSLTRSRTTMLQRRLMAWFGIRGVGSLYYLMFALQYQWLPETAHRVTAIVLTVVAISVALHGISATPLMEFYYRRRQRIAPKKDA
jgi:NhaP-type Na+/H+ or K+/H+ antiporter